MYPLYKPTKPTSSIHKLTTIKAPQNLYLL